MDTPYLWDSRTASALPKLTRFSVMKKRLVLLDGRLNGLRMDDHRFNEMAPNHSSDPGFQFVNRG